MSEEEILDEIELDDQFEDDDQFESEEDVHTYTDEEIDQIADTAIAAIKDIIKYFNSDEEYPGTSRYSLKVREGSSK